MEENKKRLKTVLKEMLKLAKKGDLKGVQKIHRKNFQPLYLEVFGKAGTGRKVTQDELNYDRARNNILVSFTTRLSEKQRQEYLEEAQKYIDILD